MTQLGITSKNVCFDGAMPRGDIPAPVAGPLCEDRAIDWWIWLLDAPRIALASSMCSDALVGGSALTTAWSTDELEQRTVSD